MPGWIAGGRDPQEGEHVPWHVGDACRGSHQIVQICTKLYRSPLLYYQHTNREVVSSGYENESWTGEVVKVGPSIKNFNVGDKVVAYITVKRPPEVSAAKAAGLPLAGLTAQQMLMGPAGIKLDGSAP
ncbi:hypothetical protein LguiA_020666 [Lonicera macranthoides]